jgi:hypothetical protein
MAKKGKPPKVIISEHALDRFQERWPECANIPRSEVARRVAEQMSARQRAGDVIETPGGFYYPISFLGKDGYAIFNEGRVTTILPEEFCPEVNNVRARN